MGVETFLIASVGASLLGSIQQQQGIEEQVDAQQAEFLRQAEEANKQAAAEKSELALQMDRQAASARAAMEAIGGFGSMNDERAQAEIAGVKAVDLSRIEGNRARQSAAFRSASRSAAQRGAAGIQQSRTQFLSTALNAGVTFSMFDAQRDREERQRTTATGTL